MSGSIMNMSNDIGSSNNIGCINIITNNAGINNSLGRSKSIIYTNINTNISIIMNIRSGRSSINTKPKSKQLAATSST
jgi:hypothetical protein